MMRLAILALVTMTVACRELGAPATPPGLHFPRHAASGPVPLALLEGGLVTRAPCILIVTPEGSAFLAVWPSHIGGRLIGGAVELIDRSGRVVAREGESIRVGGGEGPVSGVERITGRAPPAECEVAKYWLVTDIDRATPKPTPP